MHFSYSFLLLLTNLVTWHLFYKRLEEAVRFVVVVVVCLIQFKKKHLKNKYREGKKQWLERMK